MRDIRTLAIVQARFSSSRLPGKILLDIAGKPMLVRVVERMQRAKSVDLVLVATTLDPSDDETEALCQMCNYPYYRGNIHDVLNRCYQAAKPYNAEVIVRITADCPVIDPQLVDDTVDIFGCEATYDFVANRLPPPWGRTYPIGLDTEVCSFEGLERAWKEASEPHQREHVMPFFYEGIPPEALHPSPPTSHSSNRYKSLATATSPRGFHVALLHHYPDYGAMRWTVDTPEDLELLRQIYAHFEGRNDFTWMEVLALLKREPELAKINASVQHKHYRQVDARR